MGLYIIMMGVQGAGKGVQAKRLEEHYQIPQVSTGDLFRAMFGRDDELAQEVKRILNAGELVPDDITCKMVAERLAQPDAANGAILDGFPRNEAQAVWLDEHLQGMGESLTAVLWMELDLYIAFKRAFGRVTDKETGKSYNVYFNTDGIKSWEFKPHPEGAFPPHLEVELENGNPVKRRSDDENAHAVLTRIDTYMAETAPLLEHYEKQGLVLTVNADQPIDAVTQDIKAAIESRR